MKFTYLLPVTVLATGLFVGFATKPAEKAYSQRVSKFIEAEEDEASEEAREAKGMLKMMHAIRANQVTGVVDPRDVQRAIDQADRLKGQRGNFPLQWQELGPDNVGGRTRAILIDRRNNSTVYAGAVSGGLWKSTTYGMSWKKLNDLQDNQTVSSIAQTPNGDIFYGTGEGEFNNAFGNGISGFVGGGVYYSADGVTFTLLNKTDPTKAGQSAWRNVQSMAADPVADRVYAATSGGLYWSENKGVSWTVATGLGGGVVQEIKVDRNGVVYVAKKNGIWKSTDGKAYTATGTGSIVKIPTSGNRISIAVSLSDPNYVYAQVAGADNRLEGIYQSTDGAATWAKIGQKSVNNFDFDPLSNPQGGQGTYDNVIAVDPYDPGRVFATGVQFWEWKDPNTHPAAQSGWDKIAVTTGGFLGNDLYVHADKHVIIFDTLTKPYTTYIGSDGGVGKSLDGCKTFIQSNKGYNVTQFYGMAATSKGYPFGGSQDNGTQFIKGNGNTKQSAIEINGGDGFQCEASVINPDLMFYEVYNGAMVRSSNGGAAASLFFDCEMIWYVDPQYGGNASQKCEDKRGDFNNIFNTPMVLRENPVDGSSRFLTMMHDHSGNGNTLWITKDATNLKLQSSPKWYKVADMGGNPGSEPCRIELSKDWNWAWCVTATQLWRVRGLNTGSYDSILSPPIVSNQVTPTLPGNPVSNGFITNQLTSPSPGRSITGVKQDPADPNHLVVCLGNYGNSNYIYETKNALDTVNAVTWTSIQGNLPQMPVYDISFLPYTPNVLIAATELGVWVSTNGGQSWTENNSGMARVPAFQVRVYQNKPWEGPSIYVGTHGRGMFKATNLVTGIAKPTKPSASSKIELSVFPNPASDVATINLSLAKTSDVQVRVMDMGGKLVMNKNYGNRSAGQQQLPLDVASLANGMYIVNVTGGFGSASKRILVSH